MRKLGILLVLAGLWAGTTTGDAADQPAATAPQGELAAKLQEIAGRLELTDDQKTQITPILQKEVADLKALRDDTTMRRGQKARRAKEINDAASRQISALLTPEQQKEYEALRAEMREKLKTRAKERQGEEK